MVDRFNALAQDILQKQLAETKEEELEKLSRQYPYFAPAQFLLLKKLQPHTEAYNAQYQKAIIFHYDPLSFEQFLHDQPSLDFLKVPEVEEPSVHEVEQEPQPFHTEEEKIIDHDENDFVIEERKDEIVFIKEEISEGEEREVEIQLEREEETFVPPVVSMNNEPIETKNWAPYESKDEETSLPDETDLEEEQSFEQELPKIVFNQPAEPKPSDLTFEPYHTVDYFASQGIKISQDAAGQDKFGKQLKSFTDWLKTMKKLPVTEISSHLSKSTEQKVENLAEHSVEDAEVVTESMAEVWLKQGKLEKAREVYEKLSLLNPSKSAYFATKIRNLTEQN